MEKDISSGCWLDRGKLHTKVYLDFWVGLGGITFQRRKQKATSSIASMDLIIDGPFNNGWINAVAGKSERVGRRKTAEVPLGAPSSLFSLFFDLPFLRLFTLRFRVLPPARACVKRSASSPPDLPASSAPSAPPSKNAPLVHWIPLRAVATTSHVAKVKADIFMMAATFAIRYRGPADSRSAKEASKRQTLLCVTRFSVEPLSFNDDFVL
jgi:hypothetical protein